VEVHLNISICFIIYRKKDTPKKLDLLKDGAAMKTGTVQWVMFRIYRYPYGIGTYLAALGDQEHNPFKAR
jgi:hypothetical protein